MELYFHALYGKVVVEENYSFTSKCIYGIGYGF
jgi:hypothetical protein